MKRLELTGTPFLRQLDDYLLDSMAVRNAGEVKTQTCGFGVVETLLVSGHLPDPVPIGRTDWIDENQWSFIVYAQSTAKAAYGGRCYPGPSAAIRKCGLYQDLPFEGVNAAKSARRAALVPQLVRFGFFELTDPPPGHREDVEWKQLMLVPSWPPDCEQPRITGVPKSLANLKTHERTWFRMPERIFNDYVWKSIGTQVGRRVIAALYAFFDDVTYAAVNPNHLSIRGTELQASEEFMRACGQTASIRDVMLAMQWLWSKSQLFALSSEWAEGRPHPAGREYITWSRAVARSVPSDTIVFVPRYVPKPEDSV